MDLFNALSFIRSAAAPAIAGGGGGYELAVIWTRADAMRPFVLCLATKADMQLAKSVYVVVVATFCGFSVDGDVNVLTCDV